MTDGSMTFGLYSPDKKKAIEYTIEEERSTSYREIPPYTVKADGLDDLRKKLCKGASYRGDKGWADHKYEVHRKFAVYAPDASAFGGQKWVGKLVWYADSEAPIWVTTPYGGGKSVDPRTGKLSRRV